jgi:glycerophosphoryl diester phosphodiesterase
MKKAATLATVVTIAATAVFSAVTHADPDNRFPGGGCGDRCDSQGQYDAYGQKRRDDSVQLGPRPFFLVAGMDEGTLKDRLMQCENRLFYRTDFSIAHRGAALQFPEHSDVSYRAGARMGAGIVECDVTFTGDGELVCRHSECDLHTTTNIVATSLNAKCTVPWTGPGQDPEPKCCTSDLTLEEYKSLQAKMDASNPGAATAEGYLGGTASWRTDLYTGRADVLSLRESIDLNKALGVKHTPELKGAENQARVAAVFGSQAAYAQKLIDELRNAGVSPGDVWVQSFNKADILYWLENEPAFGKQAVYLDSIDPTVTPPIPRLSLDELKQLKKQGLRIFAPPMWALLAVNDAGEVVPSEYARDIKKAGLDIITWTFERADLRQGAAQGGWYYQFDPTGKAIKKDSDMYKALDVLARQVKILGIFSDWPATVTYYANCMGLR